MSKSQSHSYKASCFQWAVIALGGVVWLWHLRQLSKLDRTSLISIAAFGVSIILISLKPVYITTPGMKLGHKRQISFSLSDALTFLLLILYGPSPAIVLSGIDGLVASFRTVRRWQSNVFTLAMMTLSILATAQSYEVVRKLQDQPIDAGLHHSPLTLVLPLFVAVTVYFIVNTLVCATIIALRYHKSIWQQIIDNHLWIAVTYYPLAALAIILYACINYFGWFSALTAVPVLLVIYLSYTQYNQKVEEKLRKIEEINGLNLAIVRALAMAIDARSGASDVHAERVKVYVRGLARLFNLSELDTQALEAGAMLRDVGMLAVPDHILTKPFQLTSAELEKMKEHTVIGAEILSQVNFHYPVVPIVRHHHERWDGSGYPDGLKGEAIPLTARILAVADCFDSAREDRNHRQAFTLEQAIAWLQENAGKFFDPEIVERFVANLPEFESQITALEQQRRLFKTSPVLAPTETDNQTTAPSGSSYAQSLERISEAHREVVMWYELAQAVGRSLSLHETLTLLLNKTNELVPSTTSVVLLKEKDSPALRVVHSLGENTESFGADIIDLDNGNIGTVFASQAPLFNIDPQPDLALLKLPSEVNYKTSLVIPLTKDTVSLGVLALYTSQLEQYSSEYIRLVEAIAQLAGDAIFNALHYEATEATAYSDRLTGLPNLRAIIRAFDEATERARQLDQPFTFLMMDLDGFKEINDTLGHHTGDLFLIEISKCIKSYMRSSDFLGRYAGDEFVAILPGTYAHEVREMVERIKQAVDSHTVRTDDGRIAQGGISVGLAECDGHVTTLEELMARADAEMYADKAARKRRKAALKNNEHVIPFPIRRPA